MQKARFPITLIVTCLLSVPIGLGPFDDGPTSMLFCVFGVGIELLRCVLNGGLAFRSRSRLCHVFGLLPC